MCINTMQWTLLVLFFVDLLQSKSVARHEECERFFHSNDCYYFPCLDSHYRCGRESHLVRFSYNFCEFSRQKYLHQFNDDAQTFFNRTNRCAMVSLRDQLIDRKISGRFSCANLQMMIFQIYLKCFQNQEKQLEKVEILDFCSIVCDNLQSLINFFLNLNDGFMNLNELLSTTGENCGAELISSDERTISSLLISICLDRKNVRLKNDITKVMIEPRFEFRDYEWG